MKHEEKTIVILSPAFPANESDSVWIPAKQLFVKTLQQQFPGVHIIVLAFNYPYHTNTYQWHGATVISFNGMRTRALQRRLLWLRVWRTLNSLRRKENIIGLFSFWCGECALAGHYFGKLHRIKHMIWVSGQDATKDNRLVKWIRPAAQELVTISNFLTDEFYKNHGILPQHFVPIGIDPAVYPDFTAERDIDVLGAGSLIPLKRYDIFILLIKQLSYHFPRIKAVICGNGSEYYHLKDLIEYLQLQNNITLTGEITHPEILQYMNRSRLLLHTSSYEGFGNVCLEALYAGCPVISFTRPVYAATDNWYHADTETGMLEKALALLSATQTDYKRVLVYQMADSTKAIMKLFNYPEAG